MLLLYNVVIYALVFWILAYGIASSCLLAMTGYVLNYIIALVECWFHLYESSNLCFSYGFLMDEFGLSYLVVVTSCLKREFFE